MRAHVRLRARMAKCTRRRAGVLAYRYTPQVPKNSRELSGESRRFFLILSPLFPHRGGGESSERARRGEQRTHENRERWLPGAEKAAPIRPQGTFFTRQQASSCSNGRKECSGAKTGHIAFAALPQPSHRK